MKETDLMHVIQAELCRDPMVRLFRNNVGNGWVGADVTTTYAPLLRETARGAAGILTVLAAARRIQFGLGVGTSDLIGLRSIEITPDIVGRRIATFVAVEAKGSHSRTTEEQKTFIEVVNSLGGRAGLARSVDDAREVLTRPAK
jgi:hypothetical protein